MMCKNIIDLNNPDIEVFVSDDGSIGLFNKKLDEIYHSRQGAKKEAFEKFVEPVLCALKFGSKFKKTLKILDICYGIGYNTKTALLYFKDRIDFIDCVETDKNLVQKSSQFEFDENINKIIDKNLKTPGFIHFYIEDIRKIIKILNKKYDIIFHDGFAPYKQPQLWSEDLIKEIVSKMHFDSIYCTYNHSKPVLAALNQNNLQIGKVFKNSKVIAVIASFNKDLILNPYNELELESLKTKSAITYKDKNLDLDDKTIIKNRNLELQASKRQTLSSFLKENKFS